MNTHPAIVTVGPGLPLEVQQFPTIKPGQNEVRIRVQWTASSPLDLHQADGGLLATPPHIMGSSIAGVVVEVGPGTTNVATGDKVFGYTFREKRERAHQEFVTTEENMVGKIPVGFSMQQAVVTCNNFVSAWHTLTKDFGLELPWPKPDGFESSHQKDWILVWGGSTSVGNYVIQILKWYGYRNIMTTASHGQHEKLQGYGAAKCFDYRSGDVVDQIRQFLEREPLIRDREPRLPFILDCIGSQVKSIKPISQVAERGAKVAVMLPVIVRDAGEGARPEYTFDTAGAAAWQEGVETIGTRTHFYLQNPSLKSQLQSIIMPAALAQGIVEPNTQLVVEGASVLERAQKALTILRSKQISGARLVWRVSDDVE